MKGHAFRGWKHLGHAAAVTFLGMLVGELVSGTALYKEAEHAFYRVAQREFASQAPEQDKLVLADLSTLVSREGGGSGSVQSDLASRQMLLAEVLTALGRSGARGVFIDWTVLLPPSFRDLEQPDFAYAGHVNRALRESHDHLAATLVDVQKRMPVIVLADGLEALRERGIPLLPRPVAEHSLCTGALLATKMRPYVPEAMMGAPSTKRLPTVSDIMIARFDWPDRLYGDPSRLLFFTSTSVVPGSSYRSFWINYGYASELAKHSFVGDLLTLEQIGEDGRLKGRVVFLGDVSDPQGDDGMPLPVEIRDERSQNNGPSSPDNGSGVIAHACSVLTRTDTPIASLREGWPTWLVFGFVSLFFELASAGLAWLLTRRCDRERAFRVGLLANLTFMVMTSLALMIWGPFLLAQLGLLIPQFGSFMMTRFADVTSSVITLLLSLKKDVS